MRYGYKVFYRDDRTGVAGCMVVTTAAQAEEEKRRLERRGYSVTDVRPPEEGGYES